jgi:zinc transport system substrate-binding protein
VNRNHFIPAIILVCLTAVLAVSCGDGPAKTSGKLKVVATLFPQYDFVRQIAGDRVDVRLLLPPGVESHAFDPTPRDLADITTADLFIYTGAAMEPWAGKIADRSAEGGVLVIDASKGVELITAQGLDATEAGKDATNAGGHANNADPHIWTDPLNAKIMCGNIAAGLAARDPKNSRFYSDSNAKYGAKLDELDQKCREAFSKVATRTILYAGHFAFGYFSRRYGLDHLSPYAGFSADSEPTPQRIAELIRNMEKLGLKTVFYEELVEPRVAKVIAAQTGAEMVLLHGAHNVSRDELSRGVTYLGIMYDDLDKLKKALGYHE